MPDWLNVDQRVDHAFAELDKRIARIDKMLDEKIDRVQAVVNGLRITNTTAFDTPEVKKAEPA